MSGLLGHASFSHPTASVHPLLFFDHLRELPRPRYFAWRTAAASIGLAHNPRCLRQHKSQGYLARGSSQERAIGDATVANGEHHFLPWKLMRCGRCASGTPPLKLASYTLTSSHRCNHGLWRAPATGLPPATCKRSSGIRGAANVHPVTRWL